MIKVYKYNDNSKLSEHFTIQEFRCKCGGTHDIKIDSDLVKKLEQLRTVLNAKSIVITSGHRCSAHDKKVGGTGYGQHVNGCAADIICYDSNNKPISSKQVSCSAQDIAFGGIANIDSTYTATHVDVRTSNRWYGDETKGTSTSVTSDFYAYYGIARKSKQSRLQIILNSFGENLTIDGVIGPKTISAAKRHPIVKNQSDEYVRVIQEMLNIAGYNCGTADGVAGDMTMNAIWQACCDKIIK